MLSGEEAPMVLYTYSSMSTSTPVLKTIIHFFSKDLEINSPQTVSVKKYSANLSAVLNL